MNNLERRSFDIPSFFPKTARHPGLNAKLVGEMQPSRMPSVTIRSLRAGDNTWYPEARFTCITFGLFSPLFAPVAFLCE